MITVRFTVRSSIRHPSRIGSIKALHDNDIVDPANVEELCEEGGSGPVCHRATKVSEFGYRNCAGGVGRVELALALVCLSVRCLSQCSVASTINLLNLQVQVPFYQTWVR